MESAKLSPVCNDFKQRKKTEKYPKNISFEHLFRILSVP
jgi:hypothetical protein